MGLPEVFGFFNHFWLQSLKFHGIQHTNVEST